MMSPYDRTDAAFSERLAKSLAQADAGQTLSSAEVERRVFVVDDEDGVQGNRHERRKAAALARRKK